MGLFAGTEQVSDGGGFYLVSGPTLTSMLGSAVVDANGRVLGLAAMAPDSPDGAMRVAPIAAISRLLASVESESSMALASLTDEESRVPTRVGLPGLADMRTGPPIGKSGTSRMGAGEKALTFIAVAMFAGIGVETLNSMAK